MTESEQEVTRLLAINDQLTEQLRAELRASAEVAMRASLQLDAMGDQVRVLIEERERLLALLDER